MGTNYFHRYNRCDHCGRYDERHIGKQSAGWQFSFRAHTDSEMRLIIGSWNCWKMALTTGSIFDEYGKEWSYADFVAKVEATKDGLSHYDEMARTWAVTEDDWKDSDGWSFTNGEFS